MPATKIGTTSRNGTSEKSSNDERPLNYRREVSIHLTPARESSIKDRQHNATHVPQPVLRPGLLPAELQNKLNMHQMQAGERIYWRHGSKAHFSSVWLDEVLTQPYHSEMRHLQELVLKSKTSQKLKKDGKAGDIIFLGISTKTIGLAIQSNTKFRDRETSKDDPIIQEMIQVMGSLVAKLFKIGLPPDMVELFQKSSAAKVSLGAAHHDVSKTRFLNGHELYQGIVSKASMGNRCSLFQGSIAFLTIDKLTVCWRMSLPPKCRRM